MLEQKQRRPFSPFDVRSVMLFAALALGGTLTQAQTSNPSLRQPNTPHATPLPAGADGAATTSSSVSTGNTYNSSSQSGVSNETQHRSNLPHATPGQPQRGDNQAITTRDRTTTGSGMASSTSSAPNVHRPNGDTNPGATGLSGRDGVNATANNTAPMTSSAAGSFDRADTNHDGRISAAEAEKIPGLASRFKDLDRDRNGTLSRSEFDASASQR
ncbi:hypothetical protein [Melaminivora sp.]|uniref:hypothetical protein n=1 Tax=Melaminivora sp. TaxID=1933032 RepID=UPI0028B02B52|nr:hypothetical protein [Melaminivora sp.]